MVFLTGGTGFVGGYVLRRLLKDGREVRATVRDTKGAHSIEQSGAHAARADILDTDALAQAMEGAEAAINLVGIISELPSKGITFEKIHHRAAESFVEAAKRAGVQRIVHMSALGARENNDASEYHRTKYLGERAVVDSGLTYTIFRPSTQVGAGGEFVDMMMDMISMAPVMPVLGSGEYKMQPMDVEDTAALFCIALDTPASENRIYEAGGPRQMSYLELLDAFMQAM